MKLIDELRKSLNNGKLSDLMNQALRREELFKDPAFQDYFLEEMEAYVQPWVIKSAQKVPFPAEWWNLILRFGGSQLIDKDDLIFDINPACYDEEAFGVTQTKYQLNDDTKVFVFTRENTPEVLEVRYLYEKPHRTFDRTFRFKFSHPHRGWKVLPPKSDDLPITEFNPMDKKNFSADLGFLFGSGVRYK